MIRQLQHHNTPRATGRLLLLTVFALLFSLSPAGTSTLAMSSDLSAQPILLSLAAEQPDLDINVIVQKTVHDTSVEDEARALGGLVTKDLSIINAFAADIPARAVVHLASARGVRWISLDAAVRESQTASTDVFSTWATMVGTSVPNTFSNATAIFDSALGPNGTYGLGIDQTKGAFTGFDFEVTPGNAITKVELLLQSYSPRIAHDFKVKVWQSGKQIKEFTVKHDLFAAYVSPQTAGRVTVDITSTKTWTWADLDNPLELYLDLGGLDPKDGLYLDAIGLRVTSAPGVDTSYLKTPTSLPKAAIDASKLGNVFNKVVRATDVWNEVPAYLQGQGLTVAIVDSGMIKNKDIDGRILAKPNFNDGYHDSSDKFGHGTFVSAMVAGNGKVSDGKYIGIAPKTNLVNVRVSDDEGMAKESDVVEGLQWILNNYQKYNIRVVNLSLNATLAQSYHTSPMDAAAEVLWFNRIVVVVSAGNNGNSTIYPPANDPFVITVGATDDRGTASTADDAIAAFSAFGTTPDGVAKPDLVAPGTRIVAMLAENGKLTMGRSHPANAVDKNYFRMSGTSVSAPIVSGAAALLLQAQPTLTPDQVKYRLKASANKNWPGYSAGTAGAGYLDIYAAIHNNSTAAANSGLPISKLLTTGPNGVTTATVNWGSVNWGSVNWGSVNWGSVNWGSDYWGP